MGSKIRGYLRDFIGSDLLHTTKSLRTTTPQPSEASKNLKYHVHQISFKDMGKLYSRACVILNYLLFSITSSIHNIKSDIEHTLFNSSTEFYILFDMSSLLLVILMTIGIEFYTPLKDQIYSKRHRRSLNTRITGSKMS